MRNSKIIELYPTLEITAEGDALETIAGAGLDTPVEAFETIVEILETIGGAFERVGKGAGLGAGLGAGFGSGILGGKLGNISIFSSTALINS